MTTFLSSRETEGVLRDAGIRVKLDTLAHWRIRNIGPRWVKIEGRIYYPAASLAQYMRGEPSGCGTVPMRRRACRRMFTENPG
jgi:hypothetical protein